MSSPSQVSSAVLSAQARLEERLVELGLAPSAVQGGTSYKRGGASLCRVDVKAEFLRVQIGEAAERGAPAELRGAYRQKGWLIVRPEHLNLAEVYIEAVVAAALQTR